jgi:hypothetical protein
MSFATADCIGSVNGLEFFEVLTGNFGEYFSGVR